MTATASSVATYAIDPAHSAVEFVARHLVISKVRGRFSGVSGTLSFDESANQLTAALATIDTTTVDTREADRDAHLRSADFLLTDSHPSITFKSTSVKHDGANINLIGDLTIRGTTKQVELDTVFEGNVTDPYGNKRIAFSAETEINRADFGLTFNAALETGGLVVGDKVKIELTIQAIRQ